MRSAVSCVSSRLAPSGARTWTWNRASSFTGKKPLFAAPASGPSDPSVTTQAMTTIQRWRITKRSTAP